MEKRVPHCRLSVVRQLIDSGRVSATSSAAFGAMSMGIGRHELIAVVRNLTEVDFHKSMTTHADHRIWQDVYRPMTRTGRAYVKLTVVDDVLVVSFKEL
ncbi:MAG TPA: type II toxin-antitoxin system MqsR family toxin [Usitatibacteraceae bacterium]|nr:type II toxin-antitoxin system MqsR family toxin [Usitatibacteraceae bacterium]